MIYSNILMITIYTSIPIIHTGILEIYIILLIYIYPSIALHMNLSILLDLTPRAIIMHLLWGELVACQNCSPN